jgi:8-oxo-dGTP pyrophosphatase MutT (NUDIX family)
MFESQSRRKTKPRVLPLAPPRLHLLLMQNPSMTPIAAALLHDLDSHTATDSREQSSLSRMRDFVSRSPHAFSRSNMEGHVTASAVVAQPDASEFLLIWHRKLGRWLQPGGHMEDADRSVFAAALREAREETGLEHFGFPLRERILDVDVHPIPAFGPDPRHFHFDIRHVLAAPASETVAESGELRWFTLREAMAAGIDESLTRALTKAASSLSVHTSGDRS